MLRPIYSLEEITGRQKTEEEWLLADIRNGGYDWVLSHSKERLERVLGSGSLTAARIEAAEEIYNGKMAMVIPAYVRAFGMDQTKKHYEQYIAFGIDRGFFDEVLLSAKDLEWKKEMALTMLSKVRNFGIAWTNKNYPGMVEFGIREGMYHKPDILDAQRAHDTLRKFRLGLG